MTFRDPEATSGDLKWSVRDQNSKMEASETKKINDFLKENTNFEGFQGRSNKTLNHHCPDLGVVEEQEELGHELRDCPPCNNGSPRPTG